METETERRARVTRRKIPTPRRMREIKWIPSLPTGRWWRLGRGEAHSTMTTGPRRGYRTRRGVEDVCSRSAVIVAALTGGAPRHPSLWQFFHVEYSIL